MATERQKAWSPDTPWHHWAPKVAAAWHVGEEHVQAVFTTKSLPDFVHNATRVATAWEISTVKILETFPRAKANFLCRLLPFAKESQFRDAVPALEEASRKRRRGEIKIPQGSSSTAPWVPYDIEVAKQALMKKPKHTSPGMFDFV